MLLLHHLAGDATSWSVVGPALAADGRHVVAPDLRGHGSSRGATAYSLGSMADDVLGLADDLGLDRFDLVGHSLGASVAVIVAAQAPLRLSRLVLEDAGPPTGRREFPVPPAEPPSDVPFDWAMLVSVIGQLNDPDPRWWSDLARSPVPLLVVGGGARSANDQDELAELADLVADGRLVTVDVGHHVHAEAPDEWLGAVRPFLTPPLTSSDR